MPRTWIDGGAPFLSAATLNGLEVDLAASGKPLAGTGIDASGSTVSTTAVQAFLNACVDGDTVVIPTGAVINLDGPLTVSHRIRLTGTGELRWTAGVIGAAAITFTADGSEAVGIRINNSLGTANQTGNKQYGIRIAANYCKVHGCTTIQFQQAIAVDPGGEWHDFVIANNNVIDVPGSGDGASSGSSNGEDRGDGIVSWGAAGVIIGNRVVCRSGDDARIGIHTEGLPTYETAAPAYANSDQMVAVTGNVVSGKFRRGIVSETVARVTITGNIVEGATWWGIALIGAAARCTISGNTIKWTRTSADNQGSAWTPTRAGVMLYGTVLHPRVQGNVIYAETGAVLPYGIAVQGTTGSLASSVSIVGNTIDSADGTTNTGIYILNGANGVDASSNRIAGFTANGIYSSASTGFAAVGNTITGGPSAQYGIRTVSGGDISIANGNLIQACTTGITLRNLTSCAVASGNTILTATTGIDLFGTTVSTCQVSSNLFVSVTTHTANLPAGTVVTGANN